jgi:hypothetical protein
MSQFVKRMLGTVTVAALALTAAGCTDAGAATAASRATGPAVYSDQHAGYQAAARWFRYVATTVTVRPRTLPRLIYSAARLWVQTDRVLSVVPPAAGTRLWQFTRSRLTTYSGDHGTITGPWTTSKIITTTTGTASGTVIVSPSGLCNGGRDFTAWFRALPLSPHQRIRRLCGQRRPIPVRVHDPDRATAADARRGGAGQPRVERRAALRPYTSIEVLASGGPGRISSQASAASGSFTSGTFTIRPKTGDQLIVSISYDQHGHEYFTVTDATRHTMQTVKVTAVFYGTTGYNSAQILAMVNNSVVTAPLTDIQL